MSEVQKLLFGTIKRDEMRKKGKFTLTVPHELETVATVAAPRENPRDETENYFPSSNEKINKRANKRTKDNTTRKNK